MTRGLWVFTDHLCRECLGRILQRVDTTAAGLYRCCNCGMESAGAVESLCACGLHLKDHRDVRLRCQRNPKRGPDFPAEIVVHRIAPGEDERLIQAVLPLRDYF